jgi:hypothetical protein
MWSSVWRTLSDIDPVFFVLCAFCTVVPYVFVNHRASLASVQDWILQDRPRVQRNNIPQVRAPLIGVLE